MVVQNVIAGEGQRPSPTPLLDVRQLTHRYGEREVLTGLSFAVRKGEIVGLLGPNGCGKSTTFQILMGLTLPTGGELHFRGERVEAGDRRIRAHAGVVFQSGSLDTRLSARENLALSARLYGVAAPEGRTRADELLRFMELHDRADEAVIKWSGGMRRRLELARALLHSPELLLLDEPTSGLDEVSFQRTWERILDLRDREQVSVLLTTHRPEEAERCDHVVIVDRGVVVACGTPQELKARVAGDVLTLEADDLQGLALEVKDALGLDGKIVGASLVLEHAEGHALIPRLVEALPKARLRSVSMRRPTLADVFVNLTGRSLRDETRSEKAS